MELQGVIDEIPGLYRVIALGRLRRTPGVDFHVWTGALLPRIDAVDHVVHTVGAVSPGPVGPVARPWYWHPHQEDHLLVLHGERTVELYTHEAGRIVTFVTSADRVLRDGTLLCEGPAVLGWPTRVFHRVTSHPTLGSASVNLATHLPEFDPRINFNIYDVDTATGEFALLREGWKDDAPPAPAGGARPAHA